MVCRQRFQSTLPRGERQKTQPKHVRDNRFQSTLPRGERPPSFPARSRCCRYFNPRSREGSDGPSDVTLLTVPVFQSTLPRGERHLPQTRCPENVYFNPRSREGSDEDVTTKVDSLEISIHAPARGATVDPFFGSLDHVISIHAPARGATFGTLRSIPAASLFQSTLPRGERLLCGANLKLVIQFQSTLPRGERRNTQPRSAERRNFNPRSREGSDDAGAEACYIAAHFNPRSREGSD